MNKYVIKMEMNMYTGYNQNDKMDQTYMIESGKMK